MYRTPTAPTLLNLAAAAATVALAVGTLSAVACTSVRSPDSPASAPLAQPLEYEETITAEPTRILVSHSPEGVERRTTERPANEALEDEHNATAPRNNENKPMPSAGDKEASDPKESANSEAGGTSASTPSGTSEDAKPSGRAPHAPGSSEESASSASDATPDATEDADSSASGKARQGD